MPFDVITGHAMQVQILRTMLRNDQIPHAFIFSGIEGIGKRTAAVAFVKALNCRALQDDFCDTCVSCQKIAKQMHPDLFSIEPEKNHIKIEQIRNLQQDIAFRPLEGRKKAVIIDQADKLNQQAANCLLKTLEEPPDDTVLILIAQSTAGMLPTVLSRCQHIRFSPLREEDMLGLLCSRGMDRQRAEQLIPAAYGSIGKALYLAESDFLSLRTETAALLSGDARSRGEAALNLAKRLGDDSEGVDQVLEFLQSWYRDLLVLKEDVTGSALYNDDMAERLREAARHETRDGIMHKIKKIHAIRDAMIFNADVQLGLESIFLHMQ